MADDLNPKLWGPEPTPEQLAEAERRAREARERWEADMEQFPADLIDPWIAELPGFDQIAARFRSRRELNAFLATAAVDLDGRMPQEELQRPGGVARVLELLLARSPATW